MEETLPENEQGLPAENTLPEAPAAEAPEPGETPEPVEESSAESAEKPDNVQRRIDKLTRARHEAERNAAYWRGKAEAQKPEADPEEVAARPKQENFSSYEEYLENLTDWKLSERLKTERTRLEAEHEAQTVQRGFEAQVKTARESHADFDEVAFGNHWLPTDTMCDVIRQSDDGASLAYHLGKHPEEAARIARLAPIAQVMAIGRLQATLEAKAQPAAPVPSNAPAPITPVKPSSPGHTGLRDDLGTDDWMRKRNADLRKR